MDQMAYSNITDLTRWIEEDELVCLCTQSSEATIESGEVTDVVAEVIAGADAEIDGYLLARWPGLRNYSPVPDEINRMSALIAVYNLYLRRRAVTENWRRRYEDCRNRLEAAASGKFSLGLDESGNTATPPEAACRTDADEMDRVYTRENLRRL
jgi:phage gp36-like protein